MNDAPLRHALDCMWHFEQYNFECTCSLTAQRPAWSNLSPMTDAEWHEMVVQANRYKEFYS